MFSVFTLVQVYSIVQNLNILVSMPKAYVY